MSDKVRDIYQTYLASVTAYLKAHPEDTLAARALSEESEPHRNAFFEGHPEADTADYIQAYIQVWLAENWKKYLEAYLEAHPDELQSVNVEDVPDFPGLLSPETIQAMGTAADIATKQFATRLKAVGLVLLWGAVFGLCVLWSMAVGVGIVPGLIAGAVAALLFAIFICPRVDFLYFPGPFLALAILGSIVWLVRILAF